MAMYGDLVNALCYTAFLPVYVFLWIKEPSVAGRDVNFTFAFTMVFSWYSYLKEIPLASVMACSGMSASIAAMNLYGWPHAGQIVVQPQFLWSLLIISGNLKLSLGYKTGMAFIALAMAIAVCVYSPLVDAVQELPFLLSFTVVHIGFHYYLTFTKDTQTGLFSPFAASLILAAAFAFHISSELVKMVSVPGYALQGGFSVLRIGFFSVIGLRSTGIFRKEIDMNKAQAEQLLMVEHALQASETAMAITDNDQRIIWSNSALKQLAGSAESQLKGQKIADALSISSTEREALECSFYTSSKKGVAFVTQGRYISTEISKCPYQKNTKKIKEVDHRFLVVLKDMTSERAREEAEKSAAKEALLAQAMEESMQNLSHELRTPLNGIMGLTSLLLRDTDLDLDVKDCMTMIMTAARLLLTLINNLLDVRKLDSNMMEDFPLAPIKLQSSLQAALDFCRPCATVTNVCLKLDQARSVDLSSLVVESNALRLQQVVINLVSNAIKYTAEGTAVAVTVVLMPFEQVQTGISNAIQTGPFQQSWNKYSPSQRQHQQMAVVSVSDAGTGIHASNGANIFGKFTQLGSEPVRALGGTKTGQASGTGLGLNLCAKFLSRMNGMIWASNNVGGKGSTFSFALPLPERTLSHVGSGTNLSSIPEVANQKVWTRSKHRVLVVDDTRVNLKVTAKMLKSLGLQEVDTVSSGREALERLAKGNFNLVLSDLQMPEMSGTELSVAIQRSSLPLKPTVIAFTADTEERVAQECYDAGMKDVLYKPLTIDQLSTFFESLEHDIAQ